MLRKSFYMVLAIMLISSLSLSAQEDCKSKTSSCSSSCSTTCSTTTSHSDHGDVVESSGVQTAWNSVCPVMGEPIPQGAVTYEYQGRIWAFCCQSCLDKFKADPEKYKSNVSACGKSYIGKKS
ncbi:MAG: YHS domain-containing protein [Ignavibacteriales bacterium]|nr:YHS domain-containing protein [Ignavibacteriales bacterium]